MNNQQHQVRREILERLSKVQSPKSKVEEPGGVRLVPVYFAGVEDSWVCPVCVPVAFDGSKATVPRARVCQAHHLHPAGRLFPSQNL